MKLFLYIILAVVILLLMIVIHEFGHYIAGKILKFKINEFSVGFGPKILSKKKKNGEVFSLRLIPLGGYCAFEGETDVEDTPKDKTKAVDVFKSDNLADCPQNTATDIAQDANKETLSTPVKSFNNEKAWKRIIVLLAGGVFNLLSAVIFSFFFILIVGYAVPKVEKIYTPIMSDIVAYSQLQVGDEIVAVNGKKINVMNSLQDLTKGAKLGDKFNVTVIRGGYEMDFELTVQRITTDDQDLPEDARVYDGFGFRSENTYKNANVGTALLYSVPLTAKFSWMILNSFFELISGKIPITSLTGPVGTIGMMAQLSAFDWRNILLLLPLIASNLGLFNLLPIPALDGSKVVFTTIEWIRGKPINRKIENYIHTVGLFVLFAFVIVIDIVGMILR